MATTTNYGWTTPDDTDLVKDGAAAIRTLGSSVDTTTKALNPSTTEGDIEYRSATANTNSRLAIGTAGQILTVNSGEDAPEWAAAPSSGSLRLVSTTALSASGNFNINSCFSATYDNYLVTFSNIQGSGASFMQFGLRIGSTNATGSNYVTMGYYMLAGNTTINGQASTQSRMDNVEWGSTTTTNTSATLYLSAPFETTNTGFRFNMEQAGGAIVQRSGIHNLANSYDSLWFTVDSGTVSGNISIYGLAK
jgi:hypothetical protein